LGSGLAIAHKPPQLLLAGVQDLTPRSVVYMLSLVRRRSDWDHTCSITQSYQPSLLWLLGRPAHRPFRGLLGVHSRYGLHTRAVTVCRDRLHRRLQRFRYLHRCSGCFRLEQLPSGVCTHWESAASSRLTPEVDAMSASHRRNGNLLTLRPGSTFLDATRSYPPLRMNGDPESLYLQLGQLVAEMPTLTGGEPITPEIHRWLGRAVYLVRSMGNAIDIAAITVAADGLNNVLREQNAHQIMTVLHRSLATAEAKAPTSARGAFIAVGAGFDAFQAISKVLSTAKQDALIVDPYMDARVLTDFACTALEGVGIRLLADSASTKQTALEPAARRWTQ